MIHVGHKETCFSVNLAVAMTSLNEVQYTSRDIIPSLTSPTGWVVGPVSGAAGC